MYNLEKSQLYLKINESTSLSELINLINKCPKNTELYIEIIGKWKFIHTIVGVKEILKTINQNQIVVFVKTKDEIGLRLLHSVGIKSCDNIPLGTKDFHNEIITNRKFSINKIGEAFKTQEFEVINIIKKSGEDHIEKAFETIKDISIKNKIILGIISLSSIVIIFFLIALIVPKAIIEITTEKNLIESIVNINFIKTEKPLEDISHNTGNNFDLHPIEIRYEDEIIFPTISKIFEGKNAEGNIIIYNNFPDSITLKNGTRIQNDDGIIFLTKYYTRVPGIKAVKNKDGKIIRKPGESTVVVVASELDIYQEVIGSRGNIPPQKLNIPGLNKYLQKFIWAENKKSITGGITRWRREIQNSDLEMAKEKLQSYLFDNAKQKIFDYIKNYNETHTVQYELFPLDEFIKKEIMKVNFPEKIIGSKDQQFNVKGEILIKAFVFSKKDFYSFIGSHVSSKQNPLMKIEKINFDSLTFRKFEETPIEIRIATSIKARQSYKIDSISEEGKIFQEKIKNYLRGLKIDIGEKYLFNQEEINNVNIKIWPPIKKHFPLIKDNIVIIEK